MQVTYTKRGNGLQMTFYIPTNHTEGVHICALWVWGSVYKI